MRKGELVFDCDSTANPLVYNVWLKDTNKLPASQNNKILNITGHLVANSGIYQCISYNDIGASMKLIYLKLGSTGIFCFKIINDNFTATTINFYRMLWILCLQFKSLYPIH